MTGLLPWSLGLPTGGGSGILTEMCNYTDKWIKGGDLT